MKTTSQRQTDLANYQPSFSMKGDADHRDRETLRFGPITNSVIRKIENPPISSRVRDAEVPTKSEGPERWVDSTPNEREQPKRIATNKGKGKNRYSGGPTRLSHHDKEDVHQAVGMTLARHNMISPGGWIICPIPKAVWIEIMSEARLACRIKRRYERSAVSMQALDSADFLQVESREDTYLTRDRSAIARYVILYRDSLKASRDKQQAEGNRNWKSNYRRYRAFLMASLKSTLNGDGWGGLIPDAQGKQGRDKRHDAIRAFRAYVIDGLKITHPDFFQPAPDPEKPREFRDFADMPSFLEL